MKSLEQSALEIGEVFNRDLVDEHGDVLLEAGRYVSQRFLQELVETGRDIVFLAPTPTSLTPYSNSIVRQVRGALGNAAALVQEVGMRLSSGQSMRLDEVDAPVRQCWESIDSDPCAALGTALADSEDDVEERFRRNMRMSTMAMVAARHLKFPTEECKAVGRAALLCDVGLEENALRFDELPANSQERDRALRDFLQHPVISSEMLQDGVPGISQLELILVCQVHEQCDGQGFPRGLRRHHMHPLSRLLNVVDTFTQLTDLSPYGQGLMPSDALAYMVLHALYGTFDLSSVQALVASAAIYPVGTEVMLDDSSYGVVMRSAGEDYMAPIIRLKSSEEMLDLRSSDRKIVAPISDRLAWQRLSKARLDETLWKNSA